MGGPHRDTGTRVHFGPEPVPPRRGQELLAEFELPHSAPLPELIDGILAGGRITLCTQCAARRGITEDDVLKGVRIAGAQVFVSEAMADGTQALVY